MGHPASVVRFRMPLTYETARTKRWRATELQKENQRTLDNIEQFGCTVVSVATEEQRSGWSYSIGVYDTCGQPEVIVVGLPSCVAHYLVDEAARLLRNGTKLDEGRHPDLVGKVDCEFRPVDPKWVKHPMGWAEWYYDDEPFPVLQAVYPDLENRIPGEDGFNEYFTQPLLQPGAPMTTVEQDFWASNDPKSSLFDWPFNEGPHTGAYLSKTVHEGTEPIVFVYHDPDGDSQFPGRLDERWRAVRWCLAFTTLSMRMLA